MAPKQRKPLVERLETIAAGRKLTRDELADLAEYGGEVVEWANELDTKMADFAANAGFYTELADDAPASERRVLRQRVKDDAAATAGALRAISGYIYA
jgi:hypothetical protein